MDKIQIQIKLATEFFSPNSYINNDYEMPSIFRTHVFKLDRNIARRESFSINKTKVKFENSYLYTPVLLGHHFLSYYVPEYSLGEEDPRNSTAAVGDKYDKTNSLLNFLL